MIQKIDNLSVVLAVFNEEANIKACLTAVCPYVDDLVVVDGGSTDKTVAIAREFTKRIIATSNPSIFHINKEKALRNAKYPWVLQLDADEVVSIELMNEIREVIHNSKYKGYYISRKNYFLGDWLRKGGQYPDRVIRLVYRDAARFPCKNVHEQIEIQGAVGFLKNDLNHYPYHSVSEYRDKMIRYTKLASKDIRSSITFITIIQYIIIKPIITFVLMYFRHKGFLDGWRGFLYAVLSSFHFPLAFYFRIKNNENSTNIG